MLLLEHIILLLASAVEKKCDPLDRMSRRRGAYIITLFWLYAKRHIFVGAAAMIFEKCSNW